MFRASVVLLLMVVNSGATTRKWIVPNFRDLTIKTRTTEGVAPLRETTWFLKGARSRTENKMPSMRFLEKTPNPPSGPGRVFGPMSVGILQCDLRTVYHLQPLLKSYIKMTMPERERERPGDEISPARQLMQRNPRGPEVTITVDSVDTGERRQMGNYEARHVKTTITVEPSKGATTKPGKTEVDDWYVDLRGLGCSEPDTPEFPSQVSKIVFEVVRNGDRVNMKQLGTAHTGFAVEERSTRKDGGNVIVGKIELLEFSEQPVDPSLFEPPSDYTPRTRGQLPPGPLPGSDGWIKLHP